MKKRTITLKDAHLLLFYLETSKYTNEKYPDTDLHKKHLQDAIDMIKNKLYPVRGLKNKEGIAFNQTYIPPEVDPLK